MKIAKIKIQAPGSGERFPGALKKDNLKLSQVYWMEIDTDDLKELTKVEKDFLEFADVNKPDVEKAIEDGITPEYGEGFPVKIKNREKQMVTKTIDLQKKKSGRPKG